MLRPYDRMIVERNHMSVAKFSILLPTKDSGRRAADSARVRIDRKYLLGLAPTDPGPDAPILTRRRQRQGTAVRCSAEPPPRARPPAHRCAPRPLGSPQAQPPRLCHRDPAYRTERPGTRRTALAARPRRPGLHRAPRSLAARVRESRPAFAADRRRQAGVEETFSRGERAMGVARGRYPGLAKTHLQRALTAAAINLGQFAA